MINGCSLGTLWGKEEQAGEEALPINWSLFLDSPSSRAKSKWPSGSPVVDLDS